MIWWGNRIDYQEAVKLKKAAIKTLEHDNNYCTYYVINDVKVGPAILYKACKPAED